MKKKILFVLIGLVFIIGCGSADKTTLEVPAPGNEGVDEMIVNEGTGVVKEFDIIAKNWDFTPSTIEVNLGDKVELHVESIEGTHGFSLPEFGINERLSPGEDVHIDFIANKKGTFGFSCSIPCGSGHSRMQGQLIVN